MQSAGSFVRGGRPVSAGDLLIRSVSGSSLVNQLLTEYSRRHQVLRSVE